MEEPPRGREPLYPPMTDTKADPPDARPHDEYAVSSRHAIAVLKIILSTKSVIHAYNDAWMTGRRKTNNQYARAGLKLDAEDRSPATRQGRRNEPRLHPGTSRSGNGCRRSGRVREPEVISRGVSRRSSRSVERSARRWRTKFRRPSDSRRNAAEPVSRQTRSRSRTSDYLPRRQHRDHGRPARPGRGTPDPGPRPPGGPADDDPAGRDLRKKSAVSDRCR
jgi:hypothetical protein